ncbi:hypothetical protein BSPA14S_H0017 (plasmid) [Borreliella spielmanii A14S]|uniref:Uncharacterized protein n=1 Tax=Borreliella spielmanii A14S TaxID=498742 RepID=C0RCE3_9SPIR|nr:hypothetical protein BSPA14S_H0017 [Borreliella spielmanii A14S]
MIYIIILNKRTTISIIFNLVITVSNRLLLSMAYVLQELYLKVVINVKINYTLIILFLIISSYK